MAAFLAALLLTTFVGCNKREGGEASGSVPGFQDGEYTASWEDPAGNSGSIKLTVEKGNPTVAEYVPPQGAPASFQETMKQELPEARLVLQVHDELIVECPEAQAETAAALLKEEMENVVSLSVPLTADAHWGRNWLEAKG